MTMSIREDLKNMAESEYKEFSSKLMPTVDKETVLGVRTPKLRTYAKKLENYNQFLNDLPHKYFEENNLHAFLIEREKDFAICIEKLDRFLPYINNWATCDSMKPKVLKKYPNELIKQISKWIKSSNTYTVRYAINLLMSFYLDENYKSEYLQKVADVKSDEYYINMMRAWYFATALAKQYDDAILYIENKKLDDWTQNKTIQKATESYRISKERKEYLKNLKK